MKYQLSAAKHQTIGGVGIQAHANHNFLSSSQSFPERLAHSMALLGEP
jgi:hypothetical protein